MRQYRWCAVDAEGDVGGTGLLGVAFYSDELQAYLTDHDEIREQLMRHALAGYTFIAHNAAYDLSVIWWQLGLPMKAFYFNGRFNHGEWKPSLRARTAQLWDTSALSGIRRLADLGDALGYPKYETPASITGQELDQYRWQCERHAVWECVECYAVRDAEIVYRFVTALSEQLAAWEVEPKHTISGMAVGVWRALDSPRPIGLRDRKIRVLARDAYMGGRVECFKLGMLEPCFVADISSAYPAAMLQTPYPDVESLHYATDVPLANVRWEYEGVAEVDVSVPDQYVPPLPYTRQNERQYPVGRLRGCWPLLELRYAMELGCTVNHVYRLAFSTTTVHPFTAYISALWELREQYKRKGDARELLAKLLMNNLYGRLGMGDEIERRIVRPLGPNTSIHAAWGHNLTSIGTKQYIDQTDTLHFSDASRNVLWAAQTTAAVRVMLHKAMVLQGSSLLYCDTDSVFSSQPIVGVSDGLGRLRADGSYERIDIRGPKMYSVLRARADMPAEWAEHPCHAHGVRACDRCRWAAKVKGVPRDHALSLMHTGVATFSRPVKPLEQGRVGIDAGTWIEVSRRTYPRPYRRDPLQPGNLLYSGGWSDTRPPVNGPVLPSSGD